MTGGRRGRDQALNALEHALGHSFANRNLLRQALTHSSAADKRLGDNQRLEFLGDRVLGLVVAEALLDRFPGEPEGAIAKRYAQLVRKEVLAEVAREIALDKHIVMAAADAAATAREGALADACEAVIAALFLDGGLAAARAFVMRHWDARAASAAAPPQDAKTTLQEWAQARGLALPAYGVEAQEGPDHRPHFVVSVRLADGTEAQASGPSKRAAEQAAASALLARLEGRE
jgi:ribonuclease-3